MRNIEGCFSVIILLVAMEYPFLRVVFALQREATRIWCTMGFDCRLQQLAAQLSFMKIEI
jgi:hypothetical protein